MTKPKQNCMTCPNINKCWATHTNSGNPISTQNVLVNILVCRLQLGIDRDNAVKNLLTIFKPGMIKLMQYSRQNSAVNMDMDQLLSDMQTTAIEYLLYDYKIGDRGRATPYLFDPQQGFLTKWIRWITNKQMRFYHYHELFAPRASGDDSGYEDIDSNDKETSWDSVFNTSNDTEDTYYSNLLEDVAPIIEDGVTLNSNEYRVIKFCMANGNESNSSRHIDGLHIYLAKLLNVSRPRITRLYKRSREKLLYAYQNRPEYE